MLSTPIVGGSKPDLRSSLSGNATDGTGKMGTPLKRSEAPSATPTLRSVSKVILSALKNQSGIQLGPGLRWQVVKSAWCSTVLALSMKSIRSALPCALFFSNW